MEITKLESLKDGEFISLKKGCKIDVRLACGDI